MGLSFQVLDSILALSNLLSPVVHSEDNLYLITQEESVQHRVM